MIWKVDLFTRKIKTNRTFNRKKRNRNRKERKNIIATFAKNLANLAVKKQRIMSENEIKRVVNNL